MEPLRTRQYFEYLISQGAIARWGPDWEQDVDRRTRLAYEASVIQKQGFCSYFLILARIMQFCRNAQIPYGPGRGSVGGSLVAYAMGIHEADSLEFDLFFERFINTERVSYPDVDIDVSQRRRHEVLQFIREHFEDEQTVVLQVAAFKRSGARSTIDMVRAAKQQQDPNAGAIAEQLKKLLPEGSNITGGTKQDRELAWWLESGKRSNQQRFLHIARDNSWFDLLMKLDGIQVNLSSHAAGVVILSREDLKRLPLTSADGHTMLTGYDMYALDDLKYLKIDILGLRTLDIVSDAHKLAGGDGTIPSLMRLWREHKEDPATYELLCDADTTGVFQVETSGYRKTLKEFQPRCFEHIVQLNALYRPGALDSLDESGQRNMVEVFIERLHRREAVVYPLELRGGPAEQILAPTQGIVLYQEESMALARQLAGFSLAQADSLRRAIGKKKLDLMEQIEPVFLTGMMARGYSGGVAQIVWDWIEASGRYSWNKSHSVFYGTITFWCAYFKANHRAAFYVALINSLEADKERQAAAVSEARQHAEVRPPDVNVALDRYTLDEQGRIVFGLNGIKGMGAASYSPIIYERIYNGPYQGFEDFHRRLESIPINMKLSLVRCGAFDSLEDRAWLLARCQKANGKWWTIAEHIKYNHKLKKKRPIPDLWECQVPTARELADWEMETIGFYVSQDPMPDVNKALSRLDKSKHWGGQIESIKVTDDKYGREMAKFTLLTPSLTKQRCLVFSSSWPQCKALIQQGNRIIVRGHMDGSQVIVDGAFVAGDYKHFQVIRLSRNGSKTEELFDGQLSTIELAEASGIKVQLL